MTTCESHVKPNRVSGTLRILVMIGIIVVIIVTVIKMAVTCAAFFKHKKRRSKIALQAQTLQMSKTSWLRSESDNLARSWAKHQKLQSSLSS